MGDRKRNFLVGLTTLAGIVGFGYLVFIFGEVPAWVADTYGVTVTLNHAGGVTEGSRVRLNGVDVGYVESVRLREDPREGVAVHCEIESQYEIPSTATVRPSAGLLGGAAQLSLNTADEPTTAAVEPLPTDGSAELRGRAPADLATITEQLELAVEEQLQNFGRTTDKLAELSDQYIVVGRRVAELLEDRSLEDVDAGRVKGNITTMLARADQRLVEMQETMNTVNELLGDEQLHEDVRTTLRNARLATEDARKLAQNADANLDVVLRRYVGVADDLSRTLNSVDTLVRQAGEGEGTLGRLMADPALYESLQDASDRLSDALRDAQLLMEKWRVEGLPIQF